MSLKFKKLRESRGFTAASFSQKLVVSDRTVRYWEETDGIVPPIQMMKEIAQVLGVSTYKVFHSFLSNPDVLEDQEFHFNDHKNDLYNLSIPSLFFKFIDTEELFGEGLVIFQHRVFRYKQLTLNYLHPEDPFEDFFRPCDGMVLTDESFNSVILDEASIISAAIISRDHAHTVFKIQSKIAIFPEMDDSLHEEGTCSFYLDAYKIKSQDYLPYAKPVIVELDLNEENIIGRYIRIGRERNNLTQEQLALGLNSLGLKTKKTVISRWENGSLTPSANDFGILCVYLNISIEKVLFAFEKGYYISSALDNNDSRYDIGMHHSFWAVKEFHSLYVFMKQYYFFNMAQFSKPILLGHHECNDSENNILSILLEDQQIVIELENHNPLLINENNLVEVIPRSLNLGVYYDLMIVLQEGTSYSKHIIGLVYNIWAVTNTNSTADESLERNKPY